MKNNENILLEALEKSKLRMEQDADTWGDTGLLPEDPVYLAICEALELHNKIKPNAAPKKNPYKDLKCKYVYDYCNPETCTCSKSWRWEVENNKSEQALESYKESNNSDFVSKTKLLEWVENLLANERNLDAYDLLDKLKELTDK